ncbi:MAG: aldo/keto reductase, partial [Patescibacteria group bacterium]|nr:aldo/keto reductase [Patescibacteria group bacterium]
MDITRRRFTRNTALLAGGALLGPAMDSRGEAEPTNPLPRAKLGRTGELVTRMTLGTVPCAMPKGATPQEVADVVDEALNQGVGSVDVAPAYVQAETGAGLALGKRRDEVFLSTKVWTDSVEEAEKSFANSLQLLKTDYVDVLYLHSVGSRKQDRKPEVAMQPDGVFPWLLKQRQLGKCRFVGVSSHNAPKMCIPLLESGEVDVLLIVLNLVDRFIYNHEGILLPIAKKHGTGVVAMKIYGGSKRVLPEGVPFNVAGPAELDSSHFDMALRYTMGVEGVAAVNLGCRTRDEVRDNVAAVRAYQPLSATETLAAETLGRELAPT